MSRGIPEGLAKVMHGIADRLRAAAETGRQKGEENAAILPADMRPAFVEEFIKAWTATECRRSADEISATLDAWQAPAMRGRRGRR